VRLSTELLRWIVARAVLSERFDEAYYLAANPDVAEQYRAGEVVSAHLHFVETGWFEGRLGAPPEFDEEFYLDQNPDICAAVAAGTIASGRVHFMNQGLREGRAANPAQAHAAASWAALLEREAERLRGAGA